MALHATNVTQKVQFIIQHFHHNVANLLNGQAKAMIVTSSRPAAARYKIALKNILKITLNTVLTVSWWHFRQAHGQTD